jgi:hypothetical protein
MALIALSFLGLASFPGWHEERDARTGADIGIKQFTSRPVTHAVVWALGMASLLLMVSTLWQHVAAASVVAILSTAVHGSNVVGDIEAASIALVWLSFALAAVAFQGIIAMAFTVRLLDRLSDDE